MELALREDAKSISFTYTELIAFYEYVYDISKLAKERGLVRFKILFELILALANVERYDDEDTIE